MDLFSVIFVCVIFCILFSICGWCCKKKEREGTVYSYGGAPVTVATQHITASPVVVPPYPVDPHHPVRQPMPAAPAPGFVAQNHTGQGGYHSTPYSTVQPGYPGGGDVYPAAPYPTGYPPTNTAPYPPTTVGPYPQVGSPPYPQPTPGQLPPTYSEAVRQPPVTQEAYVKQAPYNPSFGS